MRGMSNQTEVVSFALLLGWLTSAASLTEW